MNGMKPGWLFVALSGLMGARGCGAQTGILAAGGRHLYLHCTGERHGPAVVLDAGLYRDSTDWRRVQPRTAQLTQVCSYDREGLGKSVVDKGASPETECLDVQVEELRSLLRTAGGAAAVRTGGALRGRGAGAPVCAGLPERGRGAGVCGFSARRADLALSGD